MSELRFKAISDEEIRALEANRHAKNTLRNTQCALKRFKEFLLFKQIAENIETMTEENLDNILTEFYVSIRKTDGEQMKTSTLQTLRYGLNRAFKEIRNDSRFDILKNTNFSKSNLRFNDIKKDLKSKGKGEVIHYKNICDLDLCSIYEHLDDENVNHLQCKVWFLLSYFFIRRGQENVVIMTRDNIIFTKIENEDVIILKDELNKNHGASSSENSYGGRISKETSKFAYCAIERYVLFLVKIGSVSLWPKFSFEGEFLKRSLTAREVGDFMGNISKICKLSCKYTNHCVRGTACTVLGTNFSENDIKSVSGHKSCSSLGIYKQICHNTKRNMEFSLGNKLIKNTPKKTESVSEKKLIPENFSYGIEHNFNMTVDMDEDIHFNMNVQLPKNSDEDMDKDMDLLNFDVDKFVTQKLNEQKSSTSFSAVKNNYGTVHVTFNITK